MQISCQYLERGKILDVNIQGNTVYVDDVAVTRNSSNNAKKRAARTAMEAVQSVVSDGSNPNSNVIDISVILDISRYNFIDGKWVKNGDREPEEVSGNYIKQLKTRATNSLDRARKNFEALKKYPVAVGMEVI